MIGNSQVCSICNGEEATKGCVCTHKIILIGKQCLDGHLNEIADHDIVDLKLALRMQSDPSLIDSYIDKLPDIAYALKFFRLESKRVKGIKAELNKDREKLFSKIEGIFNQFTTVIDKSEHDLHTKIGQLMLYKNSLAGEGESY